MAKCPNEFKAVLPKILYNRTSFSISGEKSHVLKSYGVNCHKIGLWFILSRASQITWKKGFPKHFKDFLKKDFFKHSIYNISKKILLFFRNTKHKENG